VLKDILALSKDTVFGKEHHFDKIDTVESYRDSVKVTSWSEMEPYVEKMKRGSTDVLFPSKAPYFVCTSGTSGDIKMMPESNMAKKVKSITTSLRIEAILKESPKVSKSKILPLVNHAIEGYTVDDTPYGSASGIALLTASQKVKEIVAFPTEITELDYKEDIDYFTMRFAMEEDVGIIFANNALRVLQLIKSGEKHFDKIVENIEQGSVDGIENIPEDIKKAFQKRVKPNPKRAQFLRDIREKGRDVVPESYWPNFGVVSCWLGGSVGRYVAQLKPYLSENITFFDIGYGATEGKFNIPISPNTPSGLLTTYSAFYEFRLVGGDDFLMAHELEVGESYELFVTTYAGLYRYPMGDIIKVNDFVGTTPMIAFDRKAGDTLNICGEKISATTFMPLIQKLIGDGLVHWNVYADDFCYHFQIEHNNKDISEEQIAKELDEILMKNIITYGVFRNQNLMHSPLVSFMKSGWSEALYRKKAGENRSIAQVKLPIVVEKPNG
jgi:hypothetical protein